MAGILNIGLLIAVGIGVLLGIHTLFTAPKTFLHGSTAMVIVGCGLLWLRYHNALLLQYDDFSHWGLIARHLLTHNALPTQEATLIQFQSYPPASAIWIYTICFFTGSGEGMMLTAQAWLVLLAVLPLFAISEKITVRSAGVFALLIIVLSMYQGTASLMVDNLLAALAIGATALTVYLRKSARSNAVSLAVILSVLCLTKDSGLFFAASVLCMHVYLVRRNRQRIRRLWWPLLLPVAARLAWWLHIKSAFSAAGLTKHAFTIENLQAVSADRTWDNLIVIGKAVARKTLSMHNQSLQMLGIMLVVCVFIVVMRFVFTRRWSFRKEATLLFCAALVYGLYLILLLGMYCFLHADPSGDGSGCF